MDRLFTVLENMLVEHKALYEIAKEKTEIIKVNDIKGLDRVLVKEEALASRIAQLESTRQQLVTECLNLSKDAKFSELVGAAPKEYKDRLEAVHLELMSIVFDLKYQNDLNQSLLKQSLEWIHLNMSLLNPQVKAVTYSNKTNQDMPPVFSNAKSRFDSRA